MATVQRFEDLLAWQKARELTREVYRTLANCRDMSFRDQIQRAAVSVMSNIAEGFESGTRQEFLNYLYIAKGSAGEVRAQLYAAYDIGYLNMETFKLLRSLAIECSRLIASFIRALKTSIHSGTQYKKEKAKAQLEREKFDLEILEQLRDANPDHFNKYFRETYERKKAAAEKNR